MPRSIRKTRGKKQARSRSKKSKRRTQRGGNNGATIYPASFPGTISNPYNVDPNRQAVSTSNQADIITGVNPANYPANLLGGKRSHKKKKMRGGNQPFLNGLTSISQMTSSGATQSPVPNSISGVSTFASQFVNGPSNYSLTNVNPPLA